MSNFVASGQQVNIFNWMRDGRGNAVVGARAGTGKTTTIKKAFEFAPEDKILYSVFNKKNQKEAMEKITDPRVDVKTLHSLGFAFIRQIWRSARPDDAVEQDRIVAVCFDIPAEVGAQVEKLVGFAKNVTINPSVADVLAIAEDRDIECPEFEREGWTQKKIAEIALKAMNEARKPDAQGRISFNDMVWLPVAMGWVRPWYQLVVVDEAQDMNLPQLEMAIKSCKRNGRIMVVGDDRQAIYGFRGAVQGAMTMLQKRLNATVLGLTTTYRCPKAVVALAAQLVPDYQAADTAPEGLVESMTEETMLQKVQVGDAILSRVNAPLTSLCLSLLRKGVAARIEGRDIGKQLCGLVRKMKARTVPEFLKKVENWADRGIHRASKTAGGQAKIDLINDQAMTLTAVAEGAKSVADIEARIMSLFQDTEEGSKPAVILSSTHKAKGLEWNRVFVLRSTYKCKGGPAPVSEESNLYYVAVTRSKSTLVLVDK